MKVAINREALALGKFVLALGLAALLSGSVAAYAQPSHKHLHKVHGQHRLSSPYPVASYSVPQFGPYSGYQYYDDSYPTYLSSVRPYLGRQASYQPGSSNYADLAFGCCGAAQHTVVSDNGTGSGFVTSGVNGSTEKKN